MPLWIPCGLLVAGLAWAVDGMAQGVRASGIERIEPRSSRLEMRSGFVDPRWNDILRQRMAALPAISPHDRDGVRRIAASVAALPFVAQVGEPQVVWPDGVDVPLRLRRPAACVRQGNQFLAVAEDGTLLPGHWPTPPWIEILPGCVGFLPVIGPNDGSFDTARPGERLVEPRHTDALVVALSMRIGLAREDFELLGPPLIDATHARSASVEVPGVVIELEQRRTVYFGRPPGTGAVGERPVEKKWADLHKAALRLRGLEGSPIGSGAATSEPRDWSFLDLRWDTTDIAWRDATAEAQKPTGQNPAPRPMNPAPRPTNPAPRPTNPAPKPPR